MTLLQDMDISLNISASPAAARTKKAAQSKKEFFKPQFKRQNKRLARDERKGNSAGQNDTEGVPVGRSDGPTKRIKQKSLADIFAGKSQRIGSQSSFRTASVSNRTIVDSATSGTTGSGDKPVVSFSKPTPKKSVPAISVTRSERKRVDSNLDTFETKPTYDKPSFKFNKQDGNSVPDKDTVGFSKQTHRNSSALSHPKPEQKQTSSDWNSFKSKHNFNTTGSRIDRSTDGLTDKPIVAFGKPTQENTLKTILAKTRDTKPIEEKKSLSDIFSKNSKASNSESTLLSSNPSILATNKNETTEFGQKRKVEDSNKSFDSNRTKKVKFDERRNKKFGEQDSPKPGFKNSSNDKNTKPTSGPGGGRGKISSLFGNNPEIPNIGQRFVKPVNESVFSGTNFSDFNIHPFMVSNLEQNMQITKLTTVQQKAIPQILSGKDVLVRSQTGSGKTLAYALPIVEKLQKIRPKLTRNSGLSALVVVPTRELALQTYECFLKLIKPFTWIVPGYLVGGEKRKAEKARLRRGCNILIATPGRLLDHIKHTEALRLNDVKCFVLDEADRMLDMGYEKDISGIVSALEEQKDLPSFGVKKSVKIENDDSGYNPLQMLRQNVRKTFTDEETNIEEIEESKIDEIEVEKERKRSGDSSDNEEDNREDVEVKQEIVSNSDESENENDDAENFENVEIKREYHSGTDSDSGDEGQDFPIRMEKLKKEKLSSETEQKVDLSKNIKNLPRFSGKIKNSGKDAPKETDSLNKTVDISDEIMNPEVQDQSEENGNRRQTVLLSATLTQAVEKLAGITMDSPVLVDAAKENLEKSGGNLNEINEDLIVPQSVVQTYIVTPPKLRLVSLSAYIAGKCQAAGQHKVLVFMATQDMIDYHADILSSILCKPSDEDDEDSEPLVDVEFFKLHGNMTQKERTEVFKTFRKARSGVLLCTDVASRGLDLPKVDCVLQYTGPLSARDYVHRVGRTARAGSSGSATIFLTPPEVQFVRMLESRRVRIQQEDMNDVLGKLLGPLSTHHSVEAAATALQNEFETLVLDDKDMHQKACKAYVSWIRFYSSYPKDMREIFDRKELHLGHYAKSFGLRDPPQRIGGIGKTLQDNEKKVHNNRLCNERPKRVFPKKQQNSGPGTKPGALKRVRMLNTSEFGSGLEPVKRPKKF